jgi:Ca2+-binding RTX toxin-like protein
MSQASALEQYLLELINAERAKAGAQALAFDPDLNEAAELHSQWMIATDTFSHTGAGGSSPTTRMKNAGYVLSGSWATAENIAWASLRSPAGYQDEVLLLHTNLMNSSGHRTNLLNGTYKEVGLGFEVGQYRSYQGAFITENFAKTGTASFLTGVAFDDLDGDRFYDPGEGLGGLAVTATSSSGIKYTTTTQPAGGYDMTLPTGTYTVSFSGANIATWSKQVSIGSSNVKVDLIDPAAAGSTSTPTPPPPPSEPLPISGTAYSETLRGTTGNDTILAYGGNDTLIGDAGADRLDGGSGNDYLYGGAGADTLTGGSGYDSFVFDIAPDGTVDTITDFSTYYDTIRIDNDAFRSWNGYGTIPSQNFVRGTAALDADDRILYDSASGSLFYDPDGTGATAPIKFAQLSAGLSLTYSDIYILE